MKRIQYGQERAWSEATYETPCEWAQFDWPRCPHCDALLGLAKRGEYIHRHCTRCGHEETTDVETWYRPAIKEDTSCETG